ncbi:MAG: hypothetical protein HBSAPP03_06840 [Phycisphaerae bacterium]|nr:MAG: hypothetical protein HBSAPP03_06840 [Phycisphaerae bacterium]
MPNRREHIGIALIAQLGVELLRKSDLSDDDRFWDVIGAALGATCGGVLPDILEPALSPDHRQFAHGMLPAAAVAWFGKGKHREGCDALYAWASAGLRPGEHAHAADGQNELPRWMRFIVAGFFRAVPTGYVSHLLADATTPRGLPVFGRLGS